MEISNNSMAIIILCSYLSLDEKMKPLKTSEWNELVSILVSKQMQPYDLVRLSKEEISKYLGLEDSFLDRIELLTSRSASITFEIDKLSRIGIGIVTRADEAYPKILKKVVGKHCPPLFYYFGNIELIKRPFIGIVGSRTIDDFDIEFTKKIVKKITENNLGIVSGGAKGIDQTASKEALRLGGYAVEYLSDSLLKRVKDLEVIRAAREGRLLLLSETNPSSGFNVGFAMKRNKYIYATSQSTVVVKSDFNKGGTWNGANENLEKMWTNTLCWNNHSYKGNMELIRRGAQPIDENWDFSNKTKELESFNRTLFDYEN